ncbi:hypothetical protein HELRODRAFT_164855 [Helobdella robusta]|uniref:BTB domain-containing protein n=1 Tax=Helobdella robusta TaxID=6412 RepID=T1EVW2_HELRO|nr:hypothetical protein HELRODRAFT_164855 [Helobdella robusta]ESN92754.1 hypothetical protein HELRODRAFT_164855 [Helobdella robusta]
MSISAYKCWDVRTNGFDKFHGENIYEILKKLASFANDKNNTRQLRELNEVYKLLNKLTNEFLPAKKSTMDMLAKGCFDENALSVLQLLGKEVIPLICNVFKNSMSEEVQQETSELIGVVCRNELFCSLVWDDEKTVESLISRLTTSKDIKHLLCHIEIISMLSKHENQIKKMVNQNVVFHLSALLDSSLITNGKQLEQIFSTLQIFIGHWSPDVKKQLKNSNLLGRISKFLNSENKELSTVAYEFVQNLIQCPSLLKRFERNGFVKHFMQSFYAADGGDEKLKYFKYILACCQYKNNLSKSNVLFLLEQISNPLTLNYFGRIMSILLYQSNNSEEFRQLFAANIVETFTKFLNRNASLSIVERSAYIPKLASSTLAQSLSGSTDETKTDLTYTALKDSMKSYKKRLPCQYIKYIISFFHQFVRETHWIKYFENKNFIGTMVKCLIAHKNDEVIVQIFQKLCTFSNYFPLLLTEMFLPAFHLHYLETEDDKSLLYDVLNINIFWLARIFNRFCTSYWKVVNKSDSEVKKRSIISLAYLSSNKQHEFTKIITRDTIIKTLLEVMHDDQDKYQTLATIAYAYVMRQCKASPLKVTNKTIHDEEVSTELNTTDKFLNISNKDVSFCFNDGQIVLSNSDVLSEKSDVFKAMFKGSFAESYTKTVKMPETSREIFTIFNDCILSGSKLPLQNYLDRTEIILGIFKLAHMYMVAFVEQQCIEIMQINIDKYLEEILHNQILLYDSTLSFHCVVYACRNINDSSICHILHEIKRYITFSDLLAYSIALYEEIL